MNDKRPIKFGDWVNCTKFIRRSGNHYHVTEPYQTPENIEKAYYCGKGSSDGIEVEDEHSCPIFQTINRRFTGVYVGTTKVHTKLWCSYEEPPYGTPRFCFQKTEQQEYAIVYYGSNRKRLVPLDGIEEADDERAVDCVL